ncbi:MAG: carbamoyltransferase C-terminal domain-containing protein, partial [Candidatus Korobacteraceae bacterium]
VVNTSFNVRGEPIICTPQDAYRCFMRTEMDVLALEDYILLKPEQPPWFEGKGEGLENEDVVQASAEKAPEKLLEELCVVFDKEFWPAAEKLKASGHLRIKEEFRKTPTMWEDANEPEDRKPLFELGREALSEDPDPVRFADELTANWLSPEVAAVLKPAVTKLIRIGLKHQVEVEIDEQVSESVYVMF